MRIRHFRKHLIQHSQSIRTELVYLERALLISVSIISFISFKSLAAPPGAIGDKHAGPDSESGQPVEKRSKAEEQVSTPPRTEVHKVYAGGKTGINEFADKVEEEVKSGRCPADKTLAAFDLDHSVLIPGEPSIAIRDSPHQLDRIQHMQVSTIALTSRQVVNSQVAQVVEEDPSAFAELASTEILRASGIPTEEKLSIGMIQIYFTKRDLRHTGLHFDQGAGIFHDHGIFYDVHGATSAQGFFWDDDRVLNHEAFTQQNLQKVLYYENGLAMGSEQPKGKVLYQLLKKKELLKHFQCIFFADDGDPSIDSIRDWFSNSSLHHLFLYKLPDKQYRSW